jgi:molybdate transport system substrate-binding protein
MRIASLAAKGAVGFAMLLAQGAAVTAAEVNVMAGNALAGVIGELGPQFERASGHKLVMQYGLSRTFKPKIEAGEAIDLIILSLETIDDLAKQGKIAADTRADVARTGLGVAVRQGASKPDINSIDAFKRSLLDAKSISWAPRTETGEYLVTVFDRLGIVEEIRARTKPQQAVDRVAKAVAEGEAELAITVTSLLMIPGVELVGKIPPELQTYLMFTASVGVAAKQPEAAKAFIKYLTSPEAAPVIKARGWEPASR